MKNKKNQIYIGLYSLLGLVGISICLFVLLYVSQQRLAALGEIRHNSDILANQLHRSSDDLTRLVRTYAVTGNKKYEQYFWDVLAIRDGLKPRPLHYNRVYWDFLAVENGEPPFPLGEPIPLKELMKEAGFTAKEFLLLAEAQRNSDQLVELEQIAINAIKGKATGAFGETPNDTSGQQRAINILFGEKYHQAKIKIMRPINMFLEELDSRTRTQFTSQSFLSQGLLISLISTFILTICVVAFVMRTSKQYHAGLINELSLRTVELEGSNKGLSIEIGEHKNTEKTLRESEENYRMLVGSVKDYAIFRTTPEGIISSWNEGVKAIKGYEADEVIGKHISIFYPEKDIKSRKIEHALQKAKEDGEYEDEGWRVKKDGSRFWANVVIAAIYDDSGNLKGYTEVTRDFTNRKQTEKALLQSEKLKSVGTITAGISHEFNNILAIISGNVQLLEGVYKDDSVLNNALNIIMKAAGDGAEISSNMLKFTKTAQDSKALVSSDISALIRHSIDFTKPRWKNEAQAKGINYEIDTESMMRVPPIMCKSVEIREVFINIINNALDVMPGGGSITFCTWSIDDTVFVSVTDSGEGMTDDVKKNIFDPFFSTKGVAGTGLGLSTVYGIVIRHGGKIDVYSEIGKGTTFTLQLPATRKRKSIIEVPDTKHETNRKNLRVLVVDDESDILDIINQLLSRSGHDVKVVNDGAEAINMIEDEVFDLVLCDLAMPNVFGYDVVNVLNRLKKRPKIGIITGWGEDHASDIDMKVDFYLRKPFKHAELIQYIDELFGADSI